MRTFEQMKSGSREHSLCRWLAALTLLLWASPSSADCGAIAGVNQFTSSGWGNDLRNTRFQHDSSISTTNVGTLKLAWAFALDGGESPHSYPLVSEDSIFIGTQSGTLYALDRSTGCTRWQYQVDSSVRTGLTQGIVTTTAESNIAAIFFGTMGGEVHAVNARTGAALWVADVADHPAAVVTGTPQYDAGNLYVPISSLEAVLAVSPLYGCCTFRGALQKLDANTGERLWRTHSIEQTPEITGRHWVFVRDWGPSGAPVWSTPSIDAARNLVYFGTGENYSSPSTTMSDAIIALDRDSGELRWSQQYTARDSFNVGCNVSANHPNCPEENGPDLDFGAPPILSKMPGVHSGTPDIVLAGQKSGSVHAIDPSSGVHLWTRSLGRGGFLGGVHWGMAVNESLGLLFVPISDIQAAAPGTTGEPNPGLSALDIATGEVRWQTPSVADCEGRMLCQNGLSAAPAANAELVFVGGLDGVVHAFAAATGEELWSFSTWRDFDTVNTLDGKAKASGGSIDVHGPLLAQDLMIVQSGYGTFGQKGGNALLVFKLDTASP